jgi:hypothetical protein
MLDVEIDDIANLDLQAGIFIEDPPRALKVKRSRITVFA